MLLSCKPVVHVVVNCLYYCSVTCTCIYATSYYFVTQVLSSMCLYLQFWKLMYVCIWFKLMLRNWDIYLLCLCNCTQYLDIITRRTVLMTYICINWEINQMNKFKGGDGSEQSFVEYCSKVYDKQITDMDQPLLVTQPQNNQVLIIEVSCMLTVNKLFE